MRNTIGDKRCFLFITNRCHNNCIYCFMNNGSEICDMDMNTYQQILVQLKDKGIYNITFIGGEPLLHVDLQRMIDSAHNEGFSISISTSGISTNSTINFEDAASKLSDVTISLDSSDKKQNDLLRGYGAYERAVQTIVKLRSLNIPVRVTATITQDNLYDIFRLAEFVQNLDCFQLDIHVMSIKGGARRVPFKEVQPKDWFDVRKQLDVIKFKYPFHISYPIMWVTQDEDLDVREYCDAKIGNRLSIMPNCECYYCTLAIGEQKPHCMAYAIQPIDISRPDFNFTSTAHFCPIERQIGSRLDNNFDYICRFIKRTTGF